MARSGDAMVLGKFPLPEPPAYLDNSRAKGPIALAVGAGGGCSDIFVSSVVPLFFVRLFWRRSDIDCNSYKGPIKTKQPTKPRGRDKE